jgi:hypothetical protein
MVFRRVLVVTALRLCSVLCGPASMTSVSVSPSPSHETFFMHILYSLSEPHARVVRNEHPRLYVLLPLLANLASGHLVPHSSDVRRRLYLAAQHALTVQDISRHLFTLKFIVTPTAGLVFFIWCIVKAKGVGPIISQPSTLHGSDLSWSMLVSLMSCVSNMATLVTYVLSVS